MWLFIENIVEKDEIAHFAYNTVLYHFSYMI